MGRRRDRAGCAVDPRRARSRARHARRQVRERRARGRRSRAADRARFHRRDDSAAERRCAARELAAGRRRAVWRGRSRVVRGGSRRRVGRSCTRSSGRAALLERSAATRLRLRRPRRRWLHRCHAPRWRRDRSRPRGGRVGARRAPFHVRRERDRARGARYRCRRAAHASGPGRIVCRGVGGELRGGLLRRERAARPGRDDASSVPARDGAGARTRGRRPGSAAGGARRARRCRDPPGGSAGSRGSPFRRVVHAASRRQRRDDRCRAGDGRRRRALRPRAGARSASVPLAPGATAATGPRAEWRLARRRSAATALRPRRRYGHAHAACAPSRSIRSAT